MAAFEQLPAALDIGVIAGDPISWTITCTGATVTAATVEILSRAGTPFAPTVTPAVSTVGNVITISLSGAQTAELANTRHPQLDANLLWSVSAHVNAAGPFELVARALTIFPVGTAGASEFTAATLAVVVGGAAVNLAVAVSTGIPPGGTTGQALVKASGADYDTAWGTVSGGGGGAVSSVNTKTGVVVLSASDVGADAAGAAAAAQAASQPLDSDLTAIAALATTAYGRAFLALVDAAAARTALALGTAATSASSAFDAAGAAAAAQAASQPLDSDLTAIAALATTSFGRSLLTQADAAAARTTLGLGTAATSASSAFDAAGAAAAAQAASQPLDSDLTAIAALTTTAFGRAFLALADIPATFTALGLGTAATQASSAFDAAGAAAAAQAASQPVDSDLTAIAALATSSFGRSLLTQADAAAARTTLGLVIGTNVQAQDAELSAIAGLTSAADKGVQFTGAGTAGTFDLTAAGRALIDDADAAAQRATLGLGSSATTAASAYATAAQGATADAAAVALTATAVKTTTYAAGANELIPADATSGGFTVTLPTAPADKTRVTLKKIDSSANAVGIACGGSDVFNKAGGSTTGSLALANQAISVQYRTTGAIWYVVGDDLPLSGLDARFATAAQGTTADGAVPKSLFDAETVLIAVSDNTPVALTIGASRILGRKATGDIAALTGAEAAALFALDVTGAPTDVTTNNASTSAHGLLRKLDNNAAHYLDGTGAWSTPAGGVSFPFGNSGGGTGFRGLPGWAAVGAGGNTGALSQYDIYTFAIFVPSAITLTGWDIFVSSGQTASTVFRVAVFASSGSTDAWQVGALISDTGTVSTATSGAKAMTGLSVALSAGTVYQIAFGADAAALVLYGLPSVLSAASPLDLSGGTNATQGGIRWWPDYTSSPDYPSVGFPTPLATASAKNTTFDTAGTAGVRMPISLRWTNP